MSSRKTRVAVVFGGRSTEHTISCVSAGSVLANLDPDRFEIVPIGITKAGGWVLGTNDPGALAIRGHELPTVDDGRALVLAGDPTSKSVVSLEPGQESEVLSGVDVVFPVLHGAFGEDGTIQGLLELADIPYVGAGVFASAAAMDKEYAKKLLAAEGLPVGRYATVRRGQSTLDDADRERLGLPVFVKPARAGSSIGISKVTDWAELDEAIALARRTDPKVLVEAAVVGREVECGVLEFPDGRVEASLPAEIRVLAEGDDAWYDFETKYLGEAAELDIPAKLDDSVTERLRACAVRAFDALDCQGLARVDFFVGENGELTINEVNTMPGFTSTSAYPKMWAVTGVDYPTLLATLVETALSRGTGLR
ncbi:D-alanine--D-alanine ligase A [Prauserella sp. PE36]|uniref:D-alanine--D-alanine ligase n=1 Tax=Prauserella endophytica TaxID=1592324 RepID=A0ABY2S8F3_9PSEU|nr:MULTISPECIES: D-alanine--D-alanine ligase family protein [Prauserella]PXY26077.1 D-alanine--D-alanine ligase A [Prauserella coralliicola]RBM20186.1 D-alanine--D-alanine ligase A [Prauserella sp. PE36]TKG71961.1 D-alanine--D-alanine ligase [Prauserella endophytica]